MFKFNTLKNNRGFSNLVKLMIKQLNVNKQQLKLDEKKKEAFFEDLYSLFYSSNNNNSNNVNDITNGIIVNGVNDVNDKNNIITYYLPTVGLTNLKFTEPNEVKFDQATIFFKILDTFKISYALFAGSSIGLLRNKKTLPFLDDYDIIIFNKDVKLFSNAMHILKKHGFKIIQNVNTKTKQKTNGGCSVYSSVCQKYYNNKNEIFNHDNESSESAIKKSYFLCDVFFSHFDDNGFLRNNASWGLYHGKNLHMKQVIPFQRHMYDGLSLPFFKNVEYEVYKCYGNIEECVISPHGLDVSIYYRSWKTAYAEFERIKQNAIDNTMKFIFCNKSSEEECEEQINNVMNVLDSTFSKNSLDVLRNIYENKIKKIYSFSMDFIIQHAASIKYYFPTVQIEYFSYSRDNDVVMYLNYIDVLYVYNDVIYNFYNNQEIIYLKKPRIDIITVLIFGKLSCDYKHLEILPECAKYSENVFVGCYDEDEEKGNCMGSCLKRVNVKKDCKFVETLWKYDGSTEFKNWCIKTCGANILITEKEYLEEINCCCITFSSCKFGTTVRENDDEKIMKNNYDTIVSKNIKKNVHFR